MNGLRVHYCGKSSGYLYREGMVRDPGEFGLPLHCSECICGTASFLNPKP